MPEGLAGNSPDRKVGDLVAHGPPQAGRAGTWGRRPTAAPRVGPSDLGCV